MTYQTTEQCAEQAAAVVVDKRQLQIASHYQLLTSLSAMLRSSPGASCSKCVCTFRPQQQLRCVHTERVQVNCSTMLV